MTALQVEGADAVAFAGEGRGSRTVGRSGALDAPARDWDTLRGWQVRGDLEAVAAAVDSPQFIVAGQDAALNFAARFYSRRDDTREDAARMRSRIAAERGRATLW